MKLENGEYLGTNNQTFHADGLIINKTVYQEKVYEGWHFHQNNHLSFILEGGNREYRRHDDHIVRSGDIMLYHSGEWHCNRYTQLPSQNINLEIEDSFLQHYEACFNGPHNVFKIPAVAHNSTDNHHYNTLFQTRARLTAIRIYHDCQSPDQHSILSVHQQLLALLQVAPGTGKEARQCFGDRTAQVIELLHDRWNENISLHDLSQITGLHPVTVSRHFAHYFDCSLGEYMRRIRVEKALFLIRQSDHSLTDIAYQCGFFDQSHFIRAFKAQTGFLPKTFRKL